VEKLYLERDSHGNLISRSLLGRALAKRDAGRRGVSGRRGDHVLDLGGYGNGKELMAWDHNESAAGGGNERRKD